MMDRATILSILDSRKDEIRLRFGVGEISLFGSAARDELRNESDIDVLVEFEGPATIDRYLGLVDFLEGLLGRRVDLVTKKGLKPRARRNVEKDLIRVA